MPFKKGNQIGKEHRFKKGQPSANPQGAGRRPSLLKVLEKMAHEEMEIEVPDSDIVVTLTNLEAAAWRFWHHLRNSRPFDVTAFKLLLEHLDGKPKEQDPALQRTPEENALLIQAALEKMNAADGITEPVDSGKRTKRADKPVVRASKTSGRSKVSKKRKKIQRRPGGAKKLQNRNR